MTIDELLAASGLSGNDEIPIWDVDAAGENTKKITVQNLATALKTLASLLGTADVANNLTTTAAGKVLDARQGKALKDLVDEKQDTLTFDSTPTSGSTNPVTSGGVAEAIQQSTAAVAMPSSASQTLDLNTIDQSSIVNYSKSSTNTPESGISGVVLTMSCNWGSQKLQIAMSSNVRGFFVRTFNASTWDAWNHMT